MKEYTRLQGGELEVTIPIRLRYDGHKTVINLPEDAPPPLDAATMTPMQKALVQGMRFRDAIEAGEAKSVSDLARKARMERVFRKAARRSRRRSRAKSTAWRWSTSPLQSTTA